MRNLILIAAIGLTGCATSMPEGTPYNIGTSYKEMYQSMRYDYRTEYNTGRDVWQSGCPQIGDCEDIALCLLEKLRQKGEKPELYRFKWNNPKTPWAHMMVKSHDILVDYYGMFHKPNERVTASHKCEQLTFDKSKVSTAGLWSCKAILQSEKDFVVKVY